MTALGHTPSDTHAAAAERTSEGQETALGHITTDIHEPVAEPSLTGDQERPATHAYCVPETFDGQPGCGTHHDRAVDSSDALPFDGHFARDTHAHAAVDSSFNGHPPRDTHPDLAVDSFETFDGHASGDTHRALAVDSAFDGQPQRDTRVSPAVDPSDALLLVYADSLDDLEHARIAAENRHRSLIQVKGLADSPEAERFEGLAAALAQLEKDATKELCRALRAHRFGPWVARTVGVGEKQGARLVASIGDPLRYVDGQTGEVVDRTVSKLWAYCGYRPDQKRTKGQRSNWNATAKMRARRVAESCLKAKARSPYGPVYDNAREKYASREDWSDLRRHNAALRVISKEVLKDLWREARALEAT